MLLKKSLIISVFISITMSCCAQITTWATAQGGLARKVKAVNSAVYVCGGFFVAKYSLQGNLIWMKTFAGGGQVYDLCVANGFVYITGFFSNSVNFNPSGNNVLTSNGSSFDVFVAKYNEVDGSYVYANRFGGTTSEIGNSIEVDASENVYVGGEFTSTVNFSMDGGNNTVSTQDNLNVKGFLVKYTQPAANSFSLAWLNTFLGSDLTQTHSSDVYSVAIDENSGIVYAAGYFSGTNTSFNSSEGNFLLSPTQSSGLNNRNAFIASYSVTTGKCINAKYLGTPFSSTSRDISLYNGDVYVIGDLFSNTITNINFDVNGGLNQRPATGAANDIFFAKYNDDSFSLGFANIIGCGTTAPPQPPMAPSQRAVAGNGIDVNATGVYITGGFMGVTDFDPNNGTSNLTATGSYRDIFYAKYSLTGSFAGAQKVGASGDDAGYSIAATNSADFYSSGLLGTSNTDLDPGPGTILLSGNGFVAGYSSAVVLPVEISSLSATLTDQKVQLQWQTNSEKNNAGFFVERKTDAEWESIGFVKGAGNSTIKTDYTFEDIPKRSGILFYRLKQTDIDGKYKYSSVLKVAMTASNQLYVGPNPANGFVDVICLVGSNELISVQIIDAAGKVLKYVKRTVPAGVFNERIALGYLRGNLFCRIQIGDQIVTKQIMSR